MKKILYVILAVLVFVALPFAVSFRPAPVIVDGLTYTSGKPLPAGTIFTVATTTATSTK